MARAIAIGGILFVVVAGCGNKAVSSGGGPNGTAANLTAYGNANCSRYERCDPNFLKSFFGDVATCTSRFVDDSQRLSALNGASITQAEVDACAAQLGSVPCGAKESDLPQCHFPGTLPIGAGCTSALQCTSGSCWHEPTPDGEEPCGKCTARVAAGADCSHGQCDQDLFCVNGKCVAGAAVGATCNDTDAPCEGALTCDNGKCAQPLGQGAPCDASAGSACDPTKGLICTLSAGNGGGQCQPAGFANLGDKCGLDATGKLTSCLGASCSDLQNGTCVPDLAEGAACDTQSGPDCAFPLQCQGGKCVHGETATCN
jgi:hypothetical protein